MSRVLKRIGYWDGPAAPAGWPDVRDFVVQEPDPGRQQAVAAYLRSGTAYVAAAGFSVCRICGAANGSTELTDGEYFVWPEGLAHYVEAHNVRLPDEVVAVAARGPAPAVDLQRFTRQLLESRDLVIADEWWRSRRYSES
jgi:hypothetical protein